MSSPSSSKKQGKKKLRRHSVDSPNVDLFRALNTPRRASTDFSEADDDFSDDASDISEDDSDIGDFSNVGGDFQRDKRVQPSGIDAKTQRENINWLRREVDKIADNLSTDGDGYLRSILENKNVLALPRFAEKLKELRGEYYSIAKSNRENAIKDLLRYGVDVTQFKPQKDRGRPRNWNKVKKNTDYNGRLTYYGTAEDLNKQKIERHGRPKHMPIFSPDQNMLDREKALLLKNTKSKMKQALAAHKKAVHFKDGDELARELNRYGVRLYQHTDTEFSPLVAERLYMSGSSYPEDIDAAPSSYDQRLAKAAPFVEVNDLIVTATQTGDTAWRDLVDTLHKHDPKKNNKFAVISGSHMQQMGMIKDKDGYISYTYATNPANFGTEGTLNVPNPFYSQDVESADELVKNNPGLQLEVRDLWHPDFEQPTPEAIRKEITDLIAKGWRVIVPACYSSDMFMPMRDKEPDEENDHFAFTQQVVAQRNIPFSEFVPRYYGDVNDFARPKANADIADE